MNKVLTIRKRINKGTFLYAIMQKYSSSLVIQVSSFVTAIFVAKFLGPEMLGYWAIFQIIVRYFPVTNLGCSMSINKEMGVNLGAGNKPEVINSCRQLFVTEFDFINTFILKTFIY